MPARQKTHPGVAIAHGLIRAYQVSLSGLVGRQCRHLPTCSEYMDEAMQRHGFWAGGWVGLARLCRCQPFGTQGLDFVPRELPQDGTWYRPWRYGRWRSTCVDPFRCDAVPAPAGTVPGPDASPGHQRLPAGSAGVSRRPDDDSPDLS